MDTLRNVMNVLACNTRATHCGRYQCNNADTPTTTGVQFRWNTHHEEISTESLQFAQHCAVPIVWATLCLLFLRQVWDFCVGENLDWGRRGKEMDEAGASESSGLAYESTRRHKPENHNLKPSIKSGNHNSQHLRRG